MDKFTYEDEEYVYHNGKFYIAGYVELSKQVLDKVSKYYFSSIDYTTMTESELVEFAVTLKDNGLYQQSIYIIENHMLQNPNNTDFIRQTVATLTSNYRLMGNYKKAIVIGSSFVQMAKYITVPLLTSLAAAYCDDKDYVKAKKYADMAYARQGGGKGYMNELSLVYKRIEKETR